MRPAVLGWSRASLVCALAQRPAQRAAIGLRWSHKLTIGLALWEEPGSVALNMLNTELYDEIILL